MRYANVTSTLALVAALGGSAYAATRVTGHDIADHSITARDIKRHALGAHVVRNAQLVDGNSVDVHSFRMSEGDTQTVLDAPPFKLTAHCGRYQGIHSPEVVAETSEPGSLYGFLQSKDAKEGWGPGKPYTVIASGDEVTDGGSFYTNYTFTALAPSGRSVNLLLGHGNDVVGSDCVVAVWSYGAR